MRLVAWNAYCASRSTRTVPEILEILRPLHADILVISEGPRDSSGTSWCWGALELPQLMVWHSDRLTLRHIRSEASVPQSGLFAISGPVSFTLLAAWPVAPKDSSLEYSAILERALLAYPELGQRTPLIFAGDLNSGASVQKQVRTHPELVTALTERGLTSAYHHQESVNHGQERVNTFRRGNRGWHIDYAFVTGDLLPAASVAIPQTPFWHSASDHLPVVLDVPDAAFARLAP